MGVNCIGPFLFTQFLLPILQKTATTAPAGSVRITWASSLAADLSAPKGGVEIDKGGAPKVQKNPELNYGQSKSGNVMFAVEAARRYGKDGIISTVGLFSTRSRCISPRGPKLTSLLGMESRTPKIRTLENCWFKPKYIYRKPTCIFQSFHLHSISSLASKC